MRQRLDTGRRALSDAVLGPPAGVPGEQTTYRVVRGIALDASPHVLILVTAQGRRQFTLAASTRAWRGERVTPDHVRPGDDVLVRLPPGRPTPDRIWAAFGRVTGTIVRIRDGRIQVDAGHALGLRTLTIARRYRARIEVRHPQLRPGRLIDVIGVYADGIVRGMLPATAQPQHMADVAPSSATPDPDRVYRGSATWFDTAPGDPEHGIAYPAIDPETETGCEAAEWPARLPYLSVGSAADLRNDCTELHARLSVLACGSAARRFNDRCVTCDTSPRGRLAALTAPAFVALGGELEDGCFNASMTLR